MPLLVAAPDKFRGTASATEIARAIARAGSRQGWSVIESPLSDGGEGWLDVFRRPGDEMETAEVTGPLGDLVGASWIRDDDRAVIEMAQASGLALVGGAGGNCAMDATTRGTGQLLVRAALALRETRQRSAPRSVRLPAGSVPTIVVGLGGSASTDGGLGAISAVEESGGLGEVELIGACDVRVGFIEAAERFAPQKGATREQVGELKSRLHRLAVHFEQRYNVDVRTIPGAGAAGGLGGALVALGGRLVSGYDLASDEVGLRHSLSQAQLVVTGEGALDAMSFDGKVVGGVLNDAAAIGIPALVVVGRTTKEACETANRHGAQVLSLSDRFGEERAYFDTLECVEKAVYESLGSFGLR